MEGLLEVVVAKELLDRREIDKGELFLFGGKTIMRFSSPNYAVKFGIEFVQNYLIPKYGIEEAARFPVTRTRPAKWIESIEDGADVVGEFIGAKPRDKQPEEIWLVVPNDRYQEVQEYLDSLKD